MPLSLWDGTTKIGADAWNAVITFINSIQNGSTSTAGLVRLATVTQARAGADSPVAVNPAGLAAALADLSVVFGSRFIASPAGGTEGQALVKRANGYGFVTLGSVSGSSPIVVVNGRPYLNPSA